MQAPGHTGGRTGQLFGETFPFNSFNNSNSNSHFGQSGAGQGLSPVKYVR